MSFEEIVIKNEKDLRENCYPGRGIIIGQSPNRQFLYQVYWIMGRSENSRNRVFEEDGYFIKIKPFDESKVVDPSLIIYHPVKNVGNKHIVSNGDQTDTIYSFLRNTHSVEDALFKRTFEPDEPNYTPRISGVIDLDDISNAYLLSILKTEYNNAEYCRRIFFYYDKAISGFGHCIHTYQNDGNPIPSFYGEPYLVRLFNSSEEVMEHYWSLLNEDNKVAMLVKQIDIEKKSFKIIIKNRLKGSQK